MIVTLRAANIIAILFFVFALSSATNDAHFEGLESQGDAPQADEGGAGVHGDVTDITFWNGFSSSFTMIFLSEIGDKTFLMTILYATRHNWFVVFLLGATSLLTMHVISVLVGYLFSQFFSSIVTAIIAAVLFFVFGVYLLYEACTEKDSKVVGEQLQDLEVELLDKKQRSEGDVKNEQSEREREEKRPWYLRVITNHYLQFLVLVTISEMGDRSQLAAITLAATYGVLSVILGGFIGHAICTFLAAVCGNQIAGRVSERCINFTGGIVFLGFAVYELLFEILMK